MCLSHLQYVIVESLSLGPVLGSVGGTQSCSDTGLALGEGKGEDRKKEAHPSTLQPPQRQCGLAYQDGKRGGCLKSCLGFPNLNLGCGRLPWLCCQALCCELVGLWAWNEGELLRTGE